MVTGQPGPVESVHPAIKNVAGAQSSGAALVSFNAPAFCSYGKEQNLNAPTGKYAAFAYTSALNALLADREHVFRVGDATVVCWARSGERGYQDVFQMFFSDFYDETDLKGLVGALCQGNPVVYDETKLDPSMDFYILGLSPNSARLSVRFSSTIRSAGFCGMSRPIMTGWRSSALPTINLRRCPSGSCSTRPSTKIPGTNPLLPTWPVKCCGQS